MQYEAVPEAKPPCTEPEIIPPGTEAQPVSWIWVSNSQYHIRFRITLVGPVGIAPFVLLIRSGATTSRALIRQALCRLSIAAPP